ncbi:MAG: membrane protein [Peptococcaceae bacterium BRH_c4b]|nr:MAG: membrane protein [Peptococcaceae bacterium BRH_c4b]
MDTSSYILLGLLIIGILGRSNLVAMSSCVLLIIKFSSLDQLLFPFLENKGLKLGLLILMIYILLPMARGQVQIKELKYNFSSVPGLIALLGGALATHLNNEGLKLMKAMPEIIFGMTLGTILGTVFLKGVPCGPVMTAAVTAILLQIYYWF